MMEIKAPENILISYVYSPHTLAEKTDPNRLFNSALLQHMKTVQSKLNEVFEQTSTDVAQKSDSRHIPWFSPSVSKNFFFAPSKQF